MCVRLNLLSLYFPAPDGLTAPYYIARKHSNVYTNESGSVEEVKDAKVRKKLFTTLPVTELR
jgi:hypothetical protein